jgi:hypothetical protein
MAPPNHLSDGGGTLFERLMYRLSVR